MSTIVDVAQKAGVSKSTVSRVLTGGPVSEGAKSRVLAAMKALNYRPNAVARGLVSNRSRLLGVLISDVADPYYSAMLRGMESSALEHQYDLLIYSTLWERDRELSYLQRLTERRVDGVVIVGGQAVGDNKLVDTYLQLVDTYLQLVGDDRPLVFIDRGLKDAAVPVIEIDNFNAAKMAVAHLITLGHTRIAHIAGPGDVAAAQARVAGYYEALKEAGLHIFADWVVAGDFKKESGEEATIRLLNMDEPPSAIFAANDLMALGAWRAALALGRSVPEDVALMGFDDIELLDLAEIPLTTVRQPRYTMGRHAIEHLVSHIDKGSASLSSDALALPTELVIRRSCGARPFGGFQPLSTLRAKDR